MNQYHNVILLIEDLQKIELLDLTSEYLKHQYIS